MGFDLDLDTKIPGDAPLVAAVLNKLLKLFGRGIGRLRPAERVPEEIAGFTARRPTVPEIERALIEVLTALETAYRAP